MSVQQQSKPFFYTEDELVAGDEPTTIIHRFHMPPYNDDEVSTLSATGSSRRRADSIIRTDLTDSGVARMALKSLQNHRRGSQQDFKTYHDQQHGLPPPQPNAGKNDIVDLSKRGHYGSMVALDTESHHQLPSMPLTSYAVPKIQRTQSILEMRCQQREQRQLAATAAATVESTDEPARFCWKKSSSGVFDISAHACVEDEGSLLTRSSLGHAYEEGSSSPRLEKQDSGGSFSSSAASIYSQLNYGSGLRRRASQDSGALCGILGSHHAIEDSVIRGSLSDISAAAAISSCVDAASDAAAALSTHQQRLRRRSGSISATAAVAASRPGTTGGRLRSAYACAASGETWVFLFEQPALANYAEFMQRVDRDNICLESIKYNPVYETFRGRVKVRNLCFRKRVFLRASYDRWRTYRDFQCQYDELSSEACDNFQYDIFSFEFPACQIGCLDFCLAMNAVDWYNKATFWDNNSGENYSALYRSPDRHNISAVMGRYEASKQQHHQQHQQLYSVFHHSPFADAGQLSGTFSPLQLSSYTSQQHQQQQHVAQPYYQLQRLHVNRYLTRLESNDTEIP